MNRHVILGLHITDRLKRASDVQKLLTAHGCIIKTRLGLHETSETACSPGGIVLLELLDREDEISDLVSELEGIPGIEVSKMVFTHT